MSLRKSSTLAAAVAVLALSTAASAQLTANAPQLMVWTTLGTAGEPIIQPDRSQPANLLTIDGKSWLIDCGDGASERLAAAGLAPAQVNTVFISHLHIDHIGGLMGLIGLRWFTQAPEKLVIYGPPGTEKLVAGLIQSLQPTEKVGLGTSGKSWDRVIADTVQVKTLTGGSDLMVDGVRVRTVRNSHFGGSDGHALDNGSESLSYRFDRDSYAIGYTGDTGPSADVAKLEQGVDLLVREVIDIGPMVEEIGRKYPQLSPQAKQSLVEHFRMQHLTPIKAGKLASASRAKVLILTHLAAVGRTAAIQDRLTAEVHATFAGDVRIAHDLDKF